MPYKKLQVNKAVGIHGIPNATVPDAVSRIGNVKQNDDGTLNIAMHYYPTDLDAEKDINLITFKLFENINVPNFENQIIAFIKNQPEFDQATDI